MERNRRERGRQRGRTERKKRVCVREGERRREKNVEGVLSGSVVRQFHVCVGASVHMCAYVFVLVSRDRRRVRCSDERMCVCVCVCV